jgi:hypothetical protein
MSPDKKVIIGANLSKEEEEQLMKFLRSNQDVFAWSAKDLEGVSREIIEHKLNIDPKFKPKKQKLRKLSEDRIQAAKAEVQRLLDAKVIREVQFTTWLANIVMVKKKNGKWRMCIDFTDLNKACPKDNFPLPRIDTLVDQAAGSEMLSFLDCFSGYHQIWMKKEDEEYTSFITPFGTYCFQRMAEGLRNAGTTFIRMTSTALSEQFGKNLLAYVDDIIVKSKKREGHIKDLQQTFSNLRKANLKLNPEKCTFGVQKGKILGCIVSAKGIDPNPEKLKAILNMEVPRNIKDVQKLTGRLASLNRFISKSAEKSFPIFQALKGPKKDFTWGQEQQLAFEEIKKYLSNPTTLVTPNSDEELLLYISATDKAVSAVLVQEKEREHSKRQEPVYFVSEALSG